MQLNAKHACLAGLLLWGTLSVSASEPENDGADVVALEIIEVTGRRVANLQPASTYAATVTQLRFDPQIDTQARGLPEGQADITVRGGLFENTGFKIGAVTIFDPQTGHYSVELPIDPDMLTSPALMTDSENSIHAFNASVATVNYGYTDIVPDGTARLGFGSDELRFASARVSQSKALGDGRKAGLTLSAAASSGDGTLPFGDHDFKRFAGHFQLSDEGQESNLIIGYQDKFSGWPGMYTGFASLPETDHVKQGLVILDHLQSNARGWWQVASAYRWLEDNYDFDRRTPDTGGPGSFEHETRSFSLGINGAQAAGGVDWTWSAMLAADRLVRSTDLTNGHFNSRTYLSMSLAPAWTWVLASGADLEVRAGLRADISNRDEDALMPLGGIRWSQTLNNGSQSFSVDLSRTSQLPGYTALNSRPTGLFGGNPDLGREFANTVTFSYDRTHGAWNSHAALFMRRDKDLVDWTFRQGAPFARQANPVDLDVTGAELLLEWGSGQWNVTGGYVFLDKDADYGEAEVDASYYALNFARHRATLALRYRPTSRLELRFDNEYRIQEKNPLRNSDREAWLAAISASWQLPIDTDLRLELVADNLTDSDFEEFPGTPAYGRQLSLGLSLDW
jgi:vitamin B12 transporter